MPIDQAEEIEMTNQTESDRLEFYKELNSFIEQNEDIIFTWAFGWREEKLPIFISVRNIDPYHDCGLLIIKFLFLKRFPSIFQLLHIPIFIAVLFC